MEDIRDFAIQGFNETVKTIKQSQAKFADTQEHYVSFVTFCNCGINTVLDKLPINKVRNLTRRDYAPCCGTQLFDAMGTSLLKLQKELKNKENTLF